MKLFYQKGFHTTSMEEILTQAGANHTTFNEYFNTKDELILAALQKRDEQFREWFAKEIDQRARTPKERLLIAFDILEEWYEGPGFHGCLFINATVEFASSENPIHKAAARHKRVFREYLQGLAEAAGADNAAALSGQLMLLMEGAIVTTQVGGKPETARQARKAAEVLIEQALAH
ncbi:MAG: TetR/AcrR family transcriptional regulator [Gammaproteobacteria bacterium]